MFWWTHRAKQRGTECPQRLCLWWRQRDWDSAGGHTNTLPDQCTIAGDCQGTRVLTDDELEVGLTWAKEWSSGKPFDGAEQ